MEHIFLRISCDVKYIKKSVVKNKQLNFSHVKNYRVLTNQRSVFVVSKFIQRPIASAPLNQVN